jgi:hypothetical protein
LISVFLPGHASPMVLKSVGLGFCKCIYLIQPRRSSFRIWAHRRGVGPLELEPFEVLAVVLKSVGVGGCKCIYLIQPRRSSFRIWAQPPTNRGGSLELEAFEVLAVVGSRFLQFAAGFRRGLVYFQTLGENQSNFLLKIR